MKKKFDYLIFIGRFQPFHIGHYDVVQKALDISENVILVLGSHNRARDPKNPFTTEERIKIIKTALDGQLSRIFFAPQVDHPYNEDRWISDVQSSVTSGIFNDWKRPWTPSPIKVGIIGYDKDHSSYYLKKFPSYELVTIEPNHPEIHATTVRTHLFECPLTQEFFVSKEHRKITEEIACSIYPKIANEIHFIKKYKEQWSFAPYPVTFMTVDSVVTQGGHILLVERRAAPGEGLLALPGGYLDTKETLKQSSLRELKEETKIDVPLPVLAGSLVKQKTYDYPGRSLRGRIITECFHYRLNENYTRPEVKGSDDARKAFWKPYSEVIMNRDKFFEDHFDIIEDMIGL